MVDPAWVALSLSKHLGGKTFRVLLRHFNDDLQEILAADEPELRQVPGIGAKIARTISEIDLESTRRAVARWQQAGVRILPRDDPAYPSQLRALDDAPPTLFVRGMWPDANDWQAYAIVGTRKPTPQACELTGKISARLAEAGYAVISGLAVGVDTTAHMGALSVPGGRTFAVLGSGVLNVYPHVNHGLAQAITGRGALLCEVSPDTTVSAPGLVARNRLITGLCEGVIVVETESDGGAMHAARFARLQGKLIYAVDSAASGNRQLIAEGAAALSPDLRELPV